MAKSKRSAAPQAAGNCPPDVTTSCRSRVHSYRAAPSAQRAGPPAAASPQLTYREGPLISAVEVFTIFWGPQWNQTPQKAMAGEVNAFFDFILTSPLIDQLAEYDVPKYAIEHGKRTGTVTITTPALKSSVTDTAIQTMLRQQIAKGKPLPQTHSRIPCTSFLCSLECAL